MAPGAPRKRRREKTPEMPARDSSTAAAVATCGADKSKAKSNAKVKATGKAATAKRTPEARRKWPAQHVDIAMKGDIDWASRRIVITDKIKEMFPGVRALTARELDMLAMNGVEFSEPTLRLIDTSQSLGRGMKPSSSASSGGHGAKDSEHTRYLQSALVQAFHVRLAL